MASDNSINLSGSCEIVSEFFGYAVNSILFQRGLYPPESFKRINKYGLTLLVSSDEGLNAYLQQVFTQMREWIHSSKIEKLVLVVTGVETKQVNERWVFNVQIGSTPNDQNNSSNNSEFKPQLQKTEKEIMNEIQAIIRQITASVTFLPLLQEACTFDLLIYTKSDANVPSTWEDSDPHYINVDVSSEVKLRSFTTTYHKVDAAVSYRQ